MRLYTNIKKMCGSFTKHTQISQLKIEYVNKYS